MRFSRLINVFVFMLPIIFLSQGDAWSKEIAFPLKFDFGSNGTASGYVTVDEHAVFNPDRQFGFLYDGQIESVTTKNKNALTGDFVTADHPFYFTVKVPEGRYKITLTLGDPEGTSATTVKAESRRLMLENVKTNNGEVVEKTIAVDVRTPKINDSTEVRRKTRELVFRNWDNQLTLEFGGPKPCISSLKIEKAEDLPVVYLAGNSTVVDQEYEPWASWGQMFPRFLKPQIVVANYAESGETLKAFRRENRLKKILSLMKPGDYLFIEFAHNDQKPGGNHVEPFTSYQDELRYFINAAKEKGGKTILVTSTNRRKFDENGKLVNTLEEYPEAMRQLAAEENIPLVDLNRMSKQLYESLGVENSKKAFVHYPANSYPKQYKALADNTHFNPYGAYQLAKCVVQDLVEMDHELSKFIVDDWIDYDPNHPDDWRNFFWPESPAIDVLKPEGS